MTPTVTKKGAAAAELAEQCRRLYLPVPTHYGEKELVFAPPRRWRFDCAWTDLVVVRPPSKQPTGHGPKLALEIDGGVFSKEPGRHTRGAGYRNDLDKLNEAIVLGWYVFRCLPEQIKSGVTIAWLERFFLANHVLLPKSPQPRRIYPNDQEKA